MQNIQLIDRFL